MKRLTLLGTAAVLGIVPAAVAFAIDATLDSILPWIMAAFIP